MRQPYPAVAPNISTVEPAQISGRRFSAKAGLLFSGAVSAQAGSITGKKFPTDMNLERVKGDFMKLQLSIAAAMAAMAVSTNTLALDVTLADKQWNGSVIPEGQQCQKFGGNNPGTPELIVSDIPAGSDTITLDYSDRDSQRMNNGGHGRMKYSFTPGVTSVTVPSVPGHSYDLPDGFRIVEAHRGPGWDKEGAYMPPCSGGKDHAYYVTVKTLENHKVTSETVLELGKY